MMLKTGAGDQAVENHVQAFVTAATTVFMHDLCHLMVQYQCAVEGGNMQDIARCCALHLLHSSKCKELEAMVLQVIEHADGMPQLAQSDLLHEVMLVYGGTSEAQRSGTAASYRRNHLVPAIVEAAVTQSDDIDSTIVDSIVSWESKWSQFVPATPFQQVVCQAINKLPL